MECLPPPSPPRSTQCVPFVVCARRACFSITRVSQPPSPSARLLPYQPASRPGTQHPGVPPPTPGSSQPPRRCLTSSLIVHASGCFGHERFTDTLASSHTDSGHFIIHITDILSVGVLGTAGPEQRVLVLSKPCGLAPQGEAATVRAAGRQRYPRDPKRS